MLELKELEELKVSGGEQEALTHQIQGIVTLRIADCEIREIAPQFKSSTQSHAE